MQVSAENLIMKAIKPVFEKLTYREQGFVYLKPCLDIIFYWSGSAFDRSDGIVAFYQQSLELIGKSLAYFRTETMSAARKLRKDTLELIPFWFQGTASRRDIYMLFLESGSAPDEPSDRAFSLTADAESGYVRLVLPPSFIVESVAPFLDLAKKMGQMLPYDFGNAGYAINWNPLGDNDSDAMEKMYALAKRYPGLDISDPFTTRFITPKGIKCVNWLTFLSKDYGDRLGGRPSLKKKLDDPVIIHEAYRGGALIQAGPYPEIGDVNRREILPLYHRVGKVLAPIRSKEHPPSFGPEGFGDEEATEKWLSRFDS